MRSEVLGWIAGVACVTVGLGVAQEPASSPGELGFVELGRHRLDGGCATALAFSADGRLLAVGGQCGDVQIHDVSDPTRPELLARFDVAHQAIEQIGFADRDRSVIARAGDVSMWHARDGELVWRTPLAFLPAGRSPRFAVGADGDFVAFVPRRGAEGSELVVARVLDGVAVARTWMPSRLVLDLTFTPDGVNLIALQRGGPMWSWRWLGAPELIADLDSVAAEPMAVRHASDGARIVAHLGKELSMGGDRLPVAEPILAIDVARNAPVVGVQMRDSALVVFDRASGGRRHIPAEPEVYAWSDDAPRHPVFALSPDGRCVALGGRDGVVRLVLGDRQVASFGGLARPARHLAFTRDGGALVAAHGTATSIFTVGGRDPGAKLDGGGPVAHTAEPNQFVQFHDASLRIVDAGSGRVLRTIPQPELEGLTIRERFLAASPHGRTLAISNRSGGWLGDPRWARAPARLYDFDRGDWQPIGAADDGRSWHLADARWSADGGACVAGLVGRYPGVSGTDELVLAWSTAPLLPLATPRGLHAPLTVEVAPDGAVRFLSDGHRIYVVPGTGAAEVVEHGVRWFRCLDGELAIAHDTHEVTLWRLDGLRAIRSLRWPERAVGFDWQTVPGIREDIELAFLTWPRLGGPMRPSADGGPIVAATISLDRRRIALAGHRDIVVWERRSEP